MQLQRHPMLRGCAAKTSVAYFWQSERPTVSDGEIARLRRMNVPITPSPHDV
jgi:hypothetical protein